MAKDRKNPWIPPMFTERQMAESVFAFWHFLMNIKISDKYLIFAEKCIFKLQHKIYKCEK
jgi:hypothetical protein